jgi:serine/threonine-protein kinase
LYASLMGATVFGGWLLAHPELAVRRKATTQPVPPMEPVAARATEPAAPVQQAPVELPVPAAEAVALAAAAEAQAAVEPARPDTRSNSEASEPSAAAKPERARTREQARERDEPSEVRVAEPTPAPAGPQVLTIKPADARRAAARDREKQQSSREPPAPPDQPEADPEVARALAQEGTNAMLRGDFDPAATKFSQALAADPSHAPAWRGRALILERKGKNAEAARAFRQFLKLSPSGAAADTVRARLQALEGK